MAWLIKPLTDQEMGSYRLKGVSGLAALHIKEIERAVPILSGSLLSAYILRILQDYSLCTKHREKETLLFFSLLKEEEEGQLRDPFWSPLFVLVIAWLNAISWNLP